MGSTVPALRGGVGQQLLVWEGEGVGQQLLVWEVEAEGGGVSNSYSGLGKGQVNSSWSGEEGWVNG